MATDHDHNKYITIHEFNELISENFTARLKQANLTRKSDIVNSVKRQNLIIKKNIISNGNKLNELSKKVKAVSTKRLTKDLINKISILNAAKCFPLGIFQNYLVFVPAKNYTKNLFALLGLNRKNLMRISE